MSKIEKTELNSAQPCLTNDGILLLKKNSKIALIGPCANSKDILGPWQFSDTSDETVTMLEGLNSRDVKISYVQGCNIDSKIENGFEEALVVAEKADVIMGDYNPSGKLTMTFPLNQGQIPIYYNIGHEFIAEKG